VSSRKDIHKIDNALIGLGVLLVFPAIAGVFLARTTGMRQVIGIALIAAPIIVLGFGIALRIRDNRMGAIWSILERTLEAKVAELSVNTGYDRELILRTVGILNRRGLAYYHYDAESDTIRDGRLRSSFLVAERCPNCGAQIGQQIPVGTANLARCDHCGTGLPAAYLNDLKLKLFAQIREQDATPSAPQRDFEIWKFAILAAVFWPAAMIYAMRRSR